MSDGDDERWLVVDGRRWRRQDPALPDAVAEQLLSHLGRGRSETRVARRKGDEVAERIARTRTNLAKHGLGERGTPWWEQPVEKRRSRWEDALASLGEMDED